MKRNLAVGALGFGVAGAVGTIAVSTALPQSTAQASEVPSSWWIGVPTGDGDWIANYDNNNPWGSAGGCTYFSASQCVVNIDWPVNFIYYGNGAYKYNVYATLANKGMGTIPDGSAWGNGYNNANGYGSGLQLYWSSEQGNKFGSDFAGCYTGPHTRYYADSHKNYNFQYNYNTQLGKYVQATSHKDMKEGPVHTQIACGAKTFGLNEQAEIEIRNLLSSNAGGFTVAVAPNYYNMQNEIYSTQNTPEPHYLNNNGYATKALLP